MAHIMSCASQSHIGAHFVGLLAGPQPELLQQHQPVHDALQDGGEGGDANACTDEHGVLRGEDPPCRGPVGAIDVALRRDKKLGEKCSSPWVLKQLLGCG